MADRHVATHRAKPGSLASHGAAAQVPAGAGPRGMWWVAWRQHQMQVLIALVVIVLVAAVVLLFQLVLVARLHAAGCTVLTDPNQCHSQAAMNAFDEQTWHLLRAVLVATPIVLGVFLGAPMFPREFEQGTQVFALTQSVSRGRWWATKITVTGVPLLAGLLGLGFLVQWCDATTWYTDRNAFRDGTFQVQSIMLAAFGLLAFAIAITAGIVVRSITASLVAGLIVAGGAVVLIAFPLRSHLVPITRDVTPIEAAAGSSEPVPAGTGGAYDPDSWVLGTGVLDADGNPMPPYASVMACQSSLPQGEGSGDAFTKALQQCERDHGITKRYRDYVPASMLWPLRGAVTALCFALAALVLAAGALRLRAAAGSRS